MENTSFEIGRMVLAKAGRDKGKAFMVVDILDDDYVLIANGSTRSVEKPKKKKIKHLEAAPRLFEDLKEKIVNRKPVFDAEIRKALEAVRYED